MTHLLRCSACLTRLAPELALTGRASGPRQVRQTSPLSKCPILFFEKKLCARVQGIAPPKAKKRWGFQRFQALKGANPLT